jgi:putative membrane-bound dehydrogenase-like protein
MRLAVLTLAVILAGLTPAISQSPTNVIKTKTGTISVPKEFVIERVAESPLVQHPMMGNFDDKGRLYIAASSGKNLRTADLEKELPNFVQRLEDTNGDGKFDKATVFADKMTLPMGALWYRGSLYVASPPNIWKLTDTDDDGVADKREILVDKFGYSGNAASVHGPFLSPTGRIFWCDGRHGHEFKDEDGKVTSKGLASRIFSMKPDGSDVQVHCGGGMDNPVEVDFWNTGEVLGSVNILLTRPRVDCLVHWQEGGAYPHHPSYKELQRTGDLLGPMTKFGHVTVSGMLRYRSGRVDWHFKRDLFTTIFNTGKVMRSSVNRTGGTFRTEENEFLTSTDEDFHPTDIVEDADGSLLVIDTGGWFRIGCPTSQIAKPELHGAIYRVRRAKTYFANAPWANDPRGLKIDFQKLSAEELITLLKDQRFAVQEKAVEELSQRERVSAGLFELFDVEQEQNRKTDRSVAQLHAVWAMSRHNGDAARRVIVKGLRASDQVVRLAAANAMGMNRDPLGLDELHKLLESSTVVERRAASHALGRIFDAPAKRREIPAGEWSSAYPRGMGWFMQPERKQAAAALLKSLSIANRNQSAEATDRATEHAAIFAVIRIDDREAVLPFMSDPDPNTRRAALIALDQMHHGDLSRAMVVRLLDTTDPQLQTAALDVVSRREGWASETTALLGKWLREPIQDEDKASVARGFLTAQAKDESVQKLVAQLLSEEISDTARNVLLEVMSQSELDQMPPVWKTPVGAAIDSSVIGHRIQAIKIIERFAISDFDAKLATVAQDDKQPADVRVATLASLGSRRDSSSDAELQFLFGEFKESKLPLSRVSAARCVAQIPLNDSQRLLLAKELAGVDALLLGILLDVFQGNLNAESASVLAESLTKNPAAARLRKKDFSRILKNADEKSQSNLNVFIDTLKPVANDLALESQLRALPQGDAERGRQLFFGRAAACASCHAVAGKGGRVGPDLTKIGAIRNRRDLLESIMFPSASFARGFRTYTAVTDRGRVFSGLIVKESTHSITILKSDLSEIRIPRGSIEQLTESDTSVMPKGLLTRLQGQQITDLLTFLESLK